MKEEERADRLARAIEDLLQGRNPDEPVDQELYEMLQIARIRLEAAQASAHAGAQHEGPVWQRVLTRLRGIQNKASGEPNGAASLLDSPATDLDIEELQDVIALRQKVAEQAASLAEAHRETVWQQVQSRIQSRQQRGGFFASLRRGQPEAAAFAAAVDRLVLGDAIWQSSDSRLEELLALAKTRRAMAQAAGAASRQSQGRLWARLRPRLADRLASGPRQPAMRTFQAPGRAWPKLAVAGAAVALLIAVFGPVPATGFADHPVAQFARFVGRHVGISETSSPPTVPPPAEVVQGTEVTVSQARELLDLPVGEPSVVPAGFEQVSSTFFPKALTADEGGVFALAYAGPSSGSAAPTLRIYQERAFGSDIAVQEGSAQDLTLSDGTPATYVEGSWQPLGSEAVWGEEGTQTLIFDREGVRTIIQYADGPALEVGELEAIAEGLMTP